MLHSDKPFHYEAPMKALLLLFISTLTFASSIDSLTADLLEDYGVSNITLSYSHKEIEKQTHDFENELTFIETLESGLHSFMTDYEDLESPLALTIEEICNELWTRHGSYECYQQGGVPKEELIRMAKVKLVVFMNNATTKMRLLKIGERAEHGERVENAWIFQLHIPQLGDYSQWVIIDRANENSAYNYGFN